jgi:hypothetical protein
MFPYFQHKHFDYTCLFNNLIDLVNVDMLIVNIWQIFYSFLLDRRAQTEHNFTWENYWNEF